MWFINMLSITYDLTVIDNRGLTIEHCERLAVGKTADITGRVTVHDLASHVGVSSQTISRYLGKKGYVAEKTSQRIKETIERLGYHPNAVARSLRLRKTMTLGLAFYHSKYMSHGDHTYFPLLVGGLSDAVSRRGYSIQFLETHPETAEGRHGTCYLQKVQDRSLDGLVIADAWLPADRILELRQYRIPVVVAGRLLEQMPGRCVLADERLKGYRLARFLLERGHRRIAYFGGERTSTETVFGIEGVEKALGEYGCRLDDRDVVCRKSSWGAQAMASRIVEVLSSPDAPTASVSMLYRATGTLVQLLQRGLRLSAERFEFAGQVCVPQEYVCKELVYVVEPIGFKLGQSSGELLLDLLEGKPERSEPVNVGVSEFSQPKCDLASMLNRTDSL